MSKVDNAVIMAAGTSSRFAPLSYEMPKALIEVKGEVLIERQIRQLQEAGVPEIYIVTGYMAEKFEYLRKKYGVKLIHNPDYLTRNNNGSLWIARDIIRNTYICSADNYFTSNPFETEVDDAYYAAIYADGETKEWCMTEGADGYVNSVTIGGYNAWFMLGHAFWDEEFSKKFIEILEAEYNLPETADKLWEKIYMAHLDMLKLKIRKYNSDFMFEFDTLGELREFDTSYVTDTRSAILKKVASQLSVTEEVITDIHEVKGNDNSAVGFSFNCQGEKFTYSYTTQEIKRFKEDKENG